MLTLVGMAIIVAGLYLGRPVLVPLALAIGVAFLLLPVVAALERCSFSRVPAVLVTLAVSFALIAILGWGVTNQFVEIVGHLPDYQANIHQKIAAIRVPASEKLGKATATMNDLGKELSSATQITGSGRQSKNATTKPIPVQVATPPRSAAEVLRDVVGPLTGLLETAGIVIIFTLFILVRREDLRNRLFRLAGSGQLNAMTQALDEASQRLGRYVLLQFVVNAGYGLLLGLGVYALHIPHSLLWGVVGFLFRFLPYVGAPIAAAFPMAMAMAVFPGWSQVAFIFGFFLILEIATANFVEPWLYGAHAGVSPLAILVAAIFWGMLWGSVGLILSTPLTVCLILAGRYVPQLSFLEIILGDEPVLSPKVHFYQRLLALDETEAREIAESFLQQNPLQSFYDSVLIPVLSLAEQDRNRDALDESRMRFIHRSIRELIEDLFLYSAKTAQVNLDTDANSAAARLPVPTSPEARIVFVPAREEADEIVCTMAMQLLSQNGQDARSVPLAPLTAMLDQTQQLDPEVVCVSALPPFAATPSRLACRQLKQRCPQSKIVLGLWGFPGGDERAREKVGLGYADEIVTSLAQIVLSIGEVNSPSRIPEEGPAEIRKRVAEDFPAIVTSQRDAT
jgi:predicted PurR-regulated permease PerM